MLVKGDPIAGRLDKKTVKIGETALCYMRAAERELKSEEVGVIKELTIGQMGDPYCLQATTKVGLSWLDFNATKDGLEVESLKLPGFLHISVKF